MQQTRANEIGERAYIYEQFENSDHPSKMWFMSGRYWWDAVGNQFIEETRPEFLLFGD